MTQSQLSDPPPHFADLARLGAPGWWRYPAGFCAILGMAILIIAVPAVPFGMTHPIEFESMLGGVSDWSTAHLGFALGGFALLLWSIIAFLPATLVIAPIIHLRPWRSFVTARPRFDWRLAGVSLGVALAVAVVLLAISLPLAGDQYEVRFHARPFLIFLPFVLLLVPLQSAAEEVFFRGYLLQAVGHASGNFWVRLLVPALLFAAVHLGNPEAAAGGVWAVLEYVTMGLYLGWLTLKTDGLEAAIALHAANNLFVFGLLNTNVAPSFTPGVFYVHDPNFAESYAGTLILVAVHWLVIRRYMRKRRGRGVAEQGERA